MIYKVWIEVEEIDADNNHYEKLDSPFAETAQFKTENKAQKFALKLHKIGKLKKLMKMITIQQDETL